MTLAKQDSSTKPNNSKYALKVKARAKAAVRLGLKANSPWPVIWAKQAEQE